MLTPVSHEDLEKAQQLRESVSEKAKEIQSIRDKVKRGDLSAMEGVELVNALSGQMIDDIDAFNRLGSPQKG